MSAFSDILELYDKESLLSIIEYCSEHGIVHIENDLFICGYPTHSSLLRRNSNKVVDKPDAWFIYIASGNLNKAFSLGKSYKYIVYERFDGRMRLVELERMRRYYGKSRHADRKTIASSC
jgi:hypothetical protein